MGCLGGLGAKLCLMGDTRSARRLTFLPFIDESGQGTRDFISKLHDLDLDTQIVQGNVTLAVDVQKAVDRCIGPIKGVV